MVLLGDGEGGTQIPRPVAFPPAFPLPPGTILTSQQPLGQGLVLNGVVPASSRATAVFFNRAMPRAGFRLAFGEAEAYEAESSYAGHGVQGRWLVREIPGCHAAAVLAVSAQR